MDDKAALKGLGRGDEAALGWLMDKYGAYVAAVAWNVLGGSLGREEAEEAAADAFLALWRSGGAIAPGKLKSWLGAVTRNRALSRLRLAKLELPLEDDILVLAGDTPEEKLERRELTKALRTAVLAMREPEREIFLRHYYYCQKLTDIASEMGLNLSTVKTKLRRGRTALGESMKKGGYNLENENF